MHILHSTRLCLKNKCPPLRNFLCKCEYTLAMPVSMYTGATVLLNNGPNIHYSVSSLQNYGSKFFHLVYKV